MTTVKDRQTIHQRLIEAGLSPNRFHGLRNKTKVAFKNFKETNKTALELNDYPSIGVNVGNGLVIVDFDEDGYPEAHNIFKNTFTVKSGGKGKPHYYLKIIGDVPNRKLKFGDLKAHDGYCVSAGSHIDYMEKDKHVIGDYTVSKNLPILEMKPQDFLMFIEPYFKDSTQRLTNSQIKNGVPKGERHQVGIRYANYLVGNLGLDYATTLVEMKRWNDACDPPNNESEIQQMVEDAINYQKTKPKQAPSNRSSYLVKTNIILLAKDIQDDYIFVVDRNTNQLYYYDEKERIYCNKTEQLLKREIAKRLDENFKVRYYKEISEYITATSPLVNMGLENPEMLAVKNGLLNVKNRELQDFSPKYFITNKLDVEFDPKVDYEKSYNAKFLKQVVSSPTQRKQMQELCGHILYRKIITETSLVCLGEGGNGKSIFLTTQKNFLGNENVSSHTIQQLCYDKFRIAELKGKLANICADLPHQELRNTGTYKALVSGDSVPISIKHVQGKGDSIEPYTKYFYSANHLPKIESEEDSYSWYRRFIFADFKKTFTKDKENWKPRQELLDKLSTPEEKSALLNWYLDGLQRLLKNGDISDKPNVDDIRKEYRKRSSSVLAYFDDNVEVTNSPEDYVFTDDWFREYVTYCSYQKRKQTSKGKFMADVEEHLSGARKAKIRRAGAKNPISAWRYVKTVPPVPPVPLSERLLEKTKNKSIKGSDSGTDGTHGTKQSTLKPPTALVCFSCKKVVHDESRCSRWNNNFYHTDCLQMIQLGYIKGEEADEEAEV